MKLKPRKSITTYVPKRAHRGHGVTFKQEVDLRRMAGLIQNEEHLSSIMMQTRADMREACLERIRPYLKPSLRSFQIPCEVVPSL